MWRTMVDKVPTNRGRQRQTEADRQTGAYKKADRLTEHSTRLWADMRQTNRQKSDRQ